MKGNQDLAAYCLTVYIFLCTFPASDVVSFDGDSRLAFRPGPGQRRGSKQVFSLKFKTLRNSGTLLEAEGREGLSLSLQLERGRLLLLLRQGETHQSCKVTKY